MVDYDEKYYDEVYWAETGRMRAYHGWQKWKKYQQTLKWTKDEPVLDVGCGAGLAMELLEANGHKVFGIDFSRVAIQHAKEEHYLDVQVANAQAIPFKDNTFGTVVCLDTLEHVQSPWLTVREINRVLKLGGALVVLVPNTGSIREQLLRQVFKFKDPCPYEDAHINFFDYATLKKLLVQTGFKVDVVTGASRLPLGILSDGLMIRAVKVKHFEVETSSKIVMRDGELKYEKR